MIGNFDFTTGTSPVDIEALAERYENPDFWRRGTIFAVALSAGVLVLLEIGRRIGVCQLAEEGETASKGLGAIEGAIFGLLGLILAFSFSGALTRFDARRHLVVEEANDIGTAWLRVALLPADAQPPMRDLFRRYLDFGSRSIGRCRIWRR
jgi:hypothetical protein